MSEPLSDESALCTACGLCCTGALHGYAQLQPSEVEAAKGVGLPRRPAPAALRFLMPCPKLEGTTCTINGDRPKVCAAYACRLLEYVRGGRALDEALVVVNEGRRLDSEPRADLAPAESFPSVRHAQFGKDLPAPTQLTAVAFTHLSTVNFAIGRKVPCSVRR